MDWQSRVKTLTKTAEVVLEALSKIPEFDFVSKSATPLRIGWKIDDFLADWRNLPMKGTHLWSTNLGDNRNLGLVYTTDGRLIVVTHEYSHKNEHMIDFHWLRRHDKDAYGSGGLKVDSLRLAEAL